MGRRSFPKCVKLSDVGGCEDPRLTCVSIIAHCVIAISPDIASELNEASTKMRQISSAGIAALIERASRLIHSSGYAEDLYPAQWVALRYYSEAPPASRTTAALAHDQGMSLGPVARTVRTLVDKGLLARAANPASRRADLIAVTASGHTLLKRDPRAAVAAIVETMPEDQREALAEAMETLLPALLARHAHDVELTSANEVGAGSALAA